jgi:hypothetical protein
VNSGLTEVTLPLALLPLPLESKAWTLSKKNAMGSPLPPAPPATAKGKENVKKMLIVTSVAIVLFAAMFSSFATQ